MESEIKRAGDYNFKGHHKTMADKRYCEHKDYLIDKILRGETITTEDKDVLRAITRQQMRHHED